MKALRTFTVVSMNGPVSFRRCGSCEYDANEELHRGREGEGDAEAGKVLASCRMTKQTDV